MPALPPDRPGCPNAPGRRRPLPDLAAIRLCRVPDSAPPYDEDIAAGEPGGARLPAWLAHGEPQDQRPGQREGPAARDRTPGAPCPPATVPGAAILGAAVPGAAVPGAGSAWQSRFAQALAEALAGSRPPSQMVPWTTGEALDRIQRLGPQLASAQRPRVRRVLTSLPAEGVMELAVVVGFGPRVKALAVRLERSEPGPAARRGEPPPGRWVCTAVEAA
jgi:Family of unknown function (DUF6459)